MELQREWSGESPSVHRCPGVPLQVEFADVVLLNKVDLAAPSDLARLRSMLGSLNPGARLLETIRCEVDLTEVLHSQRYSVDRASEAAGWQQVHCLDRWLINLGRQGGECDIASWMYCDLLASWEMLTLEVRHK